MKILVKTLKNVSPIVSPFFVIKAKTLVNQGLTRVFSGLDGTRTRDPMRDRHVF